jgi:hypothetical protein
MGSVIKYISKFWQITLRVEWDEIALIDIFYIDLKDHVKNELARSDRLEELAEMIETAIY